MLNLCLVDVWFNPSTNIHSKIEVGASVRVWTTLTSTKSCLLSVRFVLRITDSQGRERVSRVMFCCISWSRGQPEWPIQARAVDIWLKRMDNIPTSSYKCCFSSVLVEFNTDRTLFFSIYIYIKDNRLFPGYASRILLDSSSNRGVCEWRNLLNLGSKVDFFLLMTQHALEIWICLDEIWFPTWRIIPVSKWLVTPIYKP